jgi:hypothetical protein
VGLRWEGGGVKGQQVRSHGKIMITHVSI